MDCKEKEVVKIQDAEETAIEQAETDVVEEKKTVSASPDSEDELEGLNALNEETVGEEGKLEKLKKKIGRKPKKALLLVLGAAVLVAAVVFGIDLAGNTYKTPIKTQEKYANAKEYHLQDFVIDLENRLVEKQIKKIYKILRNSDYFLDTEEEFYDYSIERYESAQDEYGNDFVIKYEIIDREELTKSDLREKRAEAQEYVYYLEEIVSDTEDYTSSDWGNAAEELGLMKSEAKDLIEAIQELADEYGRIEVSEGYLLSVLVTTTGAELDEALEEEMEFNVYKVNGKWISESFGMVEWLLNI